MRALFGAAILGGACFLAGGVVSQSRVPAMFVVSQGSAETVGGIVPARIKGGAVCEAYDRSINRRLGEYSPRADGICHPEDWRVWHPFGAWPW